MYVKSNITSKVFRVLNQFNKLGDDWYNLESAGGNVTVERASRFGHASMLEASEAGFLIAEKAPDQDDLGAGTGPSKGAGPQQPSVGIIERVRKLLRLAQDAGATVGEAENAMAMASALMAKYNIEQDQLVDKPKASIGMTTTRGEWDLWANHCMGAAAKLNACDSSFMSYQGGMTGAIFYGRQESREAAVIMFLYLVNEVEKAYKQKLPPGMTKKARAEYRRTFKHACASRLHGRAIEIVDQMKKNDQIAHQATGCTALVVAHSFDQQLQETELWMDEQGFKFKENKSRGPSMGRGTMDGVRAADNIRLQNQLK